MNGYKAAIQLLKVHLLLLLCAVLVSGSFPVVAAISNDLDPIVLTLIRFALASVLFAPFIWYRYTLVVSFAALARYSLISASLVICFWSMFLALRYTTALNVSAIFTIVPGLAGIYAMVLNRERLGRPRLVALFLGIIGALWIIFRGDVALLADFSWNKGDLIFLVGCLFMGLYTPLVRLFHKGESMLQMSFWVMVTGTFWLLLLGGSKLMTVSWVDVSLRVWLGIGYLAVFSTIITFFLTQYALLFLGPTRVAAYSYLYPGLVLVLELFFGNVWPGIQILPGIVIVLAAMIVIQQMENNGS
ncbi:MAG TPA: DMT family transporter [Desulfocapsa sulfexigens]|nr:DMT family transporter [Desulfocapsa sulfexigens]